MLHEPPASEGRALIGSLCQNYIASCRGDVTRKQLATLRKVEDSSTSLATRNATIAVANWGVTRQIFLATQRLPRVTCARTGKRMLMGVPSYQLTTNFSANCQLATNFS